MFTADRLCYKRVALSRRRAGQPCSRSGLNTAQTPQLGSNPTCSTGQCRLTSPFLGCFRKRAGFHRKFRSPRSLLRQRVHVSAYRIHLAIPSTAACRSSVSRLSYPSGVGASSGTQQAAGSVRSPRLDTASGRPWSTTELATSDEQGQMTLQKEGKHTKTATQQCAGCGSRPSTLCWRGWRELQVNQP